eukprot:TRINITY_DN81689_c0_g1_i1.p1 TRINITY_DN81689_c0_g1~~TRINITY_DN81689_c0_g1_i1.p1  ORF type:complete len:301 (-),score=51.90 TRINITY_DN81689_c0_g1_i1:121-969(-)
MAKLLAAVGAFALGSRHVLAVKPADAKTLRGSTVLASNVTAGEVVQAVASQGSSNATGSTKTQPCQCVPQDAAWVQGPQRAVPKCVFIDLGAADGNTFQKFMTNGYGPLQNCPSGDWEAWLVEANPRFQAQLDALQAQYPGKVHSLANHAAYDCEAQTTFYLDLQNHAQNYWGSSMSDKHPDVQKSGLTRVTVPTININRLIMENTIPGDYVILKHDIEGSEWDTIPCLSQSPARLKTDRILLEIHPMDWQLGSTTQAEFDAATAALKAGGTDIPPYFSHTL